MQSNLKKEVINKFSKDVFPSFLAFEKERKKILTQMIITEAILALIPLLFYFNLSAINTYIEQINHASWLTALHIIVAIEILITIIRPSFICSDFQTKLQMMALPTVLKTIGNIEHFYNNPLFTKQELQNTGLFSLFSLISSDDSFVGEFKGVKYRIAELLLEAKGKKENRTTVFDGVVFAFEMNKKFNSQTTITSTGDFATRNNALFCLYVLICVLTVVTLIFGFLKINAISSVFPMLPLVLVPTLSSLLFGVMIIFLAQYISKQANNNLQISDNKIKLEDIYFNKQFNVYSDDEVETRYLLTTAFMERLSNLKKSLKLKNLKCAFIDNQVIFALSKDKNMFEFGSLFKPLNQFENISFFDELFSILDLIEYFKLNEKTGL